MIELRDNNFQQWNQDILPSQANEDGTKHENLKRSIHEFEKALDDLEISEQTSSQVVYIEVDDENDLL